MTTPAPKPEPHPGIHLWPMLPASGRYRTRRNEPTLKTCACGRQEETTSGAWRQCSVCRSTRNTKASAADRERSRQARMKGEVFIRPDGWSWETGWRDERLVELGRYLGHRKWAGPVGAGEVR